MQETDSTDANRPNDAVEAHNGGAPPGSSAAPSPTRAAWEANLRHLREHALIAGKAVEAAQARVLFPASLAKRLSTATPEQIEQLRQAQEAAVRHADEARAEAKAAETAYENALHDARSTDLPPAAHDRDDY
ncbi:MAG: hypothetical protein R6W83_10720 [Cryobacterium sp.]